MRKQFLTAFGFSFVVIILLLVSAPLGNAVPGDKDVRVVNTTAEPVPIAGTVQVATTSPVPVVNINDARQPYQLATNSTQNGTNVSLVTIGTVPAGKRLVIEFVTMTGQVPPGQHVEIFQITTVTDPIGGVTHDLLVNPQPDAVIGDALFRASQQVKLYANAGSQVKVLFRRNSSAGLATFGATISGYLVDM